MALYGTPADDGQYQIMPIWDPVEGCYEFSRFQIQDTDTKGVRGLKVDQENNQIKFQFKHNATKALNKELLGKVKNSTKDENAVAICVEITWKEAAGDGHWKGYYSAEQVQKVAANYSSDGNTPYDYTLTLNGFFTGREDVSEITVKAYVESTRGEYAVYGREHTWYNAG